MSKCLVKVVAAVSAVPLVFIVSANASSLFCNNANMYSNNFDSFLESFPNFTTIIEYQGDNVIITKYNNGNLMQRFSFNANQVALLKIG